MSQKLQSAKGCSMIMTKVGFKIRRSGWICTIIGWMCTRCRHTFLHQKPC